MDSKGLCTKYGSNDEKHLIGDRRAADTKAILLDFPF
jgi:hypothetical protein